jgi:hypothetical protein
MHHTADKVKLSAAESLKALEPRHVGFEYGEHFWLGDSLAFVLPDGTVKYGKDFTIPLQPGIDLSYGQINALAGDFYGTQYPICYGASPAAQQARFQDAFNTLAGGIYPQTPGEVTAILDLMKNEVDAVNEAIRSGVDPSTVYAKLPNINISLQKATLWRALKRTGIPAYLGLSQINMDHFGDDARVAYLAGHTVACRMAASGGTSQNLMNAYALNAFADHFLEDSFSSGHMRTPRRYCRSGGITGDMCAKVCNRRTF